MKRTFQWVTMFTVAASITAVAQQQGSTTSPGAAGVASNGQQITVQGCLQPGTGTGPSAAGSGGASPYGATGAASTGSSGSTGATASGTQGSTAQVAQPGQATGAGRTAPASGMYMLRVSDASGNASAGMPSSTAGQSDARGEAGKQQGGRVYHLMADGATDLSKHVGHQIEVTGSVVSGGHSATRGMGTGTTGSTGSGATSPTAGTTGSSTGGAAKGSMAEMAGKAGATSVLKVTNVKMIAATCQ